MSKSNPPSPGPDVPPPRAGGSYVFDPETGQRRPSDPPTAAPVPVETGPAPSPPALPDEAPDSIKKGPRK